MTFCAESGLSWENLRWLATLLNRKSGIILFLQDLWSTELHYDTFSSSSVIHFVSFSSLVTFNVTGVKMCVVEMPSLYILCIY
jgi:hypothetical protein